MFLTPFSRCKFLLLATERCIVGNMFLRATGWVTMGLVVLGTGLFVTTKQKKSTAARNLICCLTRSSWPHSLTHHVTLIGNSCSVVLQPGSILYCKTLCGHHFVLQELQRACALTIANQYNESNVMHFSFSLLRLNGLYMFRTLLSRPQEVLHKQHWVHGVRLSVGRGTVAVLVTLHARNIPSAVCAVCPDDEHVMFETCRVPWFLNWMKIASRWLHYTDILWCTVSRTILVSLLQIS
jgi:hypothetical protein